MEDSDEEFTSISVSYSNGRFTATEQQELFQFDQPDPIMGPKMRANRGLWSGAAKVASQPLQQYQGQMVADVAPQTQQAWNLAANSGNVGRTRRTPRRPATSTPCRRRRRMCEPQGQLSNTQSAAVRGSVRSR